MKALKYGLLKLFYKIHAELITPPGLPTYDKNIKIMLNDVDINQFRVMIINKKTKSSNDKFKSMTLRSVS